MNVVFAERRIEGDLNYCGVIRYMVWNENGTLGTYGVMHNEHGTPFAASRDFHRLATPEEVADYQEMQRYYKLSDAEQEIYEHTFGYPHARTVREEGCPYIGNFPCICDGSGMVGVTTDDERAFAIAHMMADDGREIH